MNASIIAFVTRYNGVSDPLEKLQLIMQWGDAQLTAPQPNMAIIDGCLSRVMYECHITDGVLHFDGWSNSQFFAGFIQLCHFFYDGELTVNLTEEDFTWVDDIDLLSDISSQRGNAIEFLINHIKTLVLG